MFLSIFSLNPLGRHLGLPASLRVPKHNLTKIWVKSDIYFWNQSLCTHGTNQKRSRKRRKTILNADHEVFVLPACHTPLYFPINASPGGSVNLPGFQILSHLVKEKCAVLAHLKGDYYARLS